jgi:hypothetical protein
VSDLWNVADCRHLDRRIIATAGDARQAAEQHADLARALPADRIIAVTYDGDTGDLLVYAEAVTTGAPPAGPAAQAAARHYRFGSQQ